MLFRLESTQGVAGIATKAAEHNYGRVLCSVCVQNQYCVKSFLSRTLLLVIKRLFKLLNSFLLLSRI